ncbi:MAG: hypothetical protein J7L15_08245 [Clostridiales bacterium]|nr:hypothetical protein [Clostridiales bacterium]
MQQRKILLGTYKRGKNRGFTTKEGPVSDILCAYDLTKFCSPECSACQIDKGTIVMCMRTESAIGILPED